MYFFWKVKLYLCSSNQVGTQMVSTDRYKLMCRMHVPVYLFPNAQDDMFLMYHYHVGIAEFIYKFNYIFLNYLGKYSYCFFFYFEKKGCGWKSLCLCSLYLYLMWTNIWSWGAAGCYSWSLGSMHDLSPNVPKNLPILWLGKFVYILQHEMLYNFPSQMTH